MDAFSTLAASRSGLADNWASRFGNVGMSIKKTDPNNSDRSVADTVGMMGQHAREASMSPQIRQALNEAGCLQDGLNEDQLIERVFSYIKRRVRFVQDEHQLASIFEQPNSKELLITPPALLSMKQPRGDCDDFSMLCCSMLMALRIKCDYVTVAADGGHPNEFSHIYCLARTRDGRAIPLDISHGEIAGWETERQFRKMVWPVFDFGLRGRGMGGGLGMIVSGKDYEKDWQSQFRKNFKGLSGLGQTCISEDPTTGDCLAYDTTDQLPVDQVLMTGPNPTPAQIAAGMPSSNSTVAVTSNSNAAGQINWNNILPNLFGSVEKIAQQTSQPAGVQTQTCNAQGVCTSTSTVLPTGYAGSLSIPGLTGSGSSIWIIVAIGVAALFFMERQG